MNDDQNKILRGQSFFIYMQVVITVLLLWPIFLGEFQTIKLSIQTQIPNNQLELLDRPIQNLYMLSRQMIG